MRQTKLKVLEPIGQSNRKGLGARLSKRRHEDICDLFSTDSPQLLGVSLLGSVVFMRTGEFFALGELEAVLFDRGLDR